MIAMIINSLADADTVSCISLNIISINMLDYKGIFVPTGRDKVGIGTTGLAVELHNQPQVVEMPGRNINLNNCSTILQDPEAGPNYSI
ncbi:hypothetical protein BMS3Abin07_02283 [bacterium BMS3Abin07]|nr:hypothetical protein BMS3Abin07_02283 [bacterium BMS3Abin07]GBE32376.1 hypothetical protein BMS3Bbin05_01291 [bacterium BMS3Bbin05]